MLGTFWVAGAGLAGLLVGSFTNVVVTRVPEGRSILRPRSRCPGCLVAIRAEDNIPLVSYIALRGRCRYCNMRISPRYPATEILCAGLFATVTWRLGVQMGRIALAVFGMFASAVLLAVALVDIETRRIPRSIVYWALGVVVPLGVVVAVFEGRPGELLRGAAASLVLGTFLLLVHELNPKWMGFGDVRFGFFLGWTLGLFGWVSVLAGFMLAVLTGSVVGLALIAAGRSRLGQAIPFGPFLSIGAYVGMLWGPDLASWYFRLLSGGLGL